MTEQARRNQIRRPIVVNITKQIAWVAMLIFLSFNVNTNNKSNMVVSETLLGVFDPAQGGDESTMTAMDQWMGKKNAIQNVFVGWDWSTISWIFTNLENIWNHGYVPMITWMPKYDQMWTPTDIEVQIASGAHDQYIFAFGQKVAQYIAGPDGALGTGDDRRIYIRFGHEMNGNWYPWSAELGSTSPQDYINMWNRVRGNFESPNVGLTRSLTANSIQWVWSPINFDVGAFKMEEYYPGSTQVDWVGVSGFNFGYSESWSGWWGISDLYAAPIARVKTLAPGKPTCIPEYSTVSIGGSIDEKNSWISDFWNFVTTNDVRMALYFNLDKTEGSGWKDWAVYGGTNGNANYASRNGYSGYQTGAQKSTVIGADPNNARVISDNYFKGNFGTSTPVTPTPIPAPVAPITPVTGGSSVFNVYNDTTNDNQFVFYIWSSGGEWFDLSYVPDSSHAPEGNTVLFGHSTNWAGCGFFIHQNSAPLKLTSFTTLSFWLSSTIPLRVEMKDVNGGLWTSNLSAHSDATWYQVSIPLNQPIGGSSTIDFNNVVGVFMITSEVFGNWMVDQIKFT